MAHVKKLVITINFFYRRITSFLRWMISPARKIHTIYKVLRPCLWLITGNELKSKKKMIFAFAGHDHEKNYWSNLAFGSAAEQRCICRTWLWDIPKIIKKNNGHCSFIVVEIPNAFRFLSKYLRCLFIPSWVNGEIEIGVDTDRLFKNENSSLKTDISKIRKNKYEYELTTEISKLRHFYWDMYVPYITKVHEDRAKIMSYDYVKKQFTENGLFNELLLVKRQEKYIAGVLLRYTKSKAKLSTLGVKDGNLDYVKKGVIGSIFYFSFQYLLDKGFKQIDFGGSRSFLRDGVLRYKKKWNQKISNKKEIGFLLKLQHQTEGIEGFLLNNPFIYEDRTGLNGIVFVGSRESLSTQYLSDIYKDYHINGLSKVVVCQLDQISCKMNIKVPLELYERMEICSAESIFTNKNK